VPLGWKFVRQAEHERKARRRRLADQIVQVLHRRQPALQRPVVGAPLVPGGLRRTLSLVILGTGPNLEPGADRPARGGERVAAAKARVRPDAPVRRLQVERGNQRQDAEEDVGALRGDPRRQRPVGMPVQRLVLAHMEREAAFLLGRERGVIRIGNRLLVLPHERSEHVVEVLLGQLATLNGNCPSTATSASPIASRPPARSSANVLARFRRWCDPGRVRDGRYVESPKDSPLMPAIVTWVRVTRHRPTRLRGGGLRRSRR
jgi:hypothetical protein